jgi:WD40 repeat protein
VFDTKVRVAAFTPDGSKLAVGMGSSTGIGKQPRDGTVAVLDATTLEVLQTVQDAKEYVTDIRFSVDGSLAAVASADASVRANVARCSGVET